MSLMNRINVAGNPYQGATKRVLCVCSGGVLRSPTTAHLLSAEPYNFNTRAAGIDEYHALVPVDEVLVRWAQEIVLMENHHAIDLFRKFVDAGDNQNQNIVVLNIPDRFAYMQPELKVLIKEAYDNLDNHGWTPGHGS
jgi:predicted protein tyrosine phosphatase